MTWRAMKESDIQLGTLVRLANLDDTYNNGTIVSIEDIPSSTDKLVKVARPYAYASKDYNSTPLLGAEVIGYYQSSLLHNGTTVFQGRDDIRTFAT